MTDPQIALFMLGIFIFCVFLGFPIAFTLMAVRILQVNYDRLVRNIDPNDPDAIDVREIEAREMQAVAAQN